MGRLSEARKGVAGCVAGAWRLESPLEDNSRFPSATLVDLGMSRVKTDSQFVLTTC